MPGNMSRREQTIEEFNAWYDANQELKAEQAAAGEVGGREISLVPEPEAMAYPSAPDNLVELDLSDLESTRYRGGWSAFRQRIFILTLAETGSVHRAAKEARMSARGAYALRVRSTPFRAAWDTAQQLAVGRLSALAFDRAINGRPEQMWKDGNLVGERRVPNDRLLQWLLARLDPKRFAMPWEQRAEIGDPQGVAAAAFPGTLDALVDIDEDPID